DRPWRYSEDREAALSGIGTSWPCIGRPQKTTAPGMRSAARCGRTGLGGLPADALLQFRLKGIDIGLVDDLGGNDDKLVFGDLGTIALKIFRHQVHALIAPLVG